MVVILNWLDYKIKLFQQWLNYIAENNHVVYEKNTLICDFITLWFISQLPKH